MGFRAGSRNGNDADVEAKGDAAVGTKGGRVKSKRGIILILAGLVVTGIAASWGWLRRMPKN